MRRSAMSTKDSRRMAWTAAFTVRAIPGCLNSRPTVGLIIHRRKAPSPVAARSAYSGNALEHDDFRVGIRRILGVVARDADITESGSLEHQEQLSGQVRAYAHRSSLLAHRLAVTQEADPNIRRQHLVERIERTQSRAELDDRTVRHCTLH